MYVHILRLDKLASMDELVAKEEGDDYGQAKVVGQERLVVEVADEGCEAFEDDDERYSEDGPQPIPRL